MHECRNQWSNPLKVRTGFNLADMRRSAALRNEVAAVLAPLGLVLSERKTRITHIDQGFDFLGMHIQRHKQRGSDRRHVYTYPTRAALQAVKGKVKAATTRRTTNLPLSALLHHLNRVLRGWTAYHQHGASSRTFSYLASYTWCGCGDGCVRSIRVPR